MPDPRNQLDVRTRQRLTGELGRLVRELGTRLAESVGPVELRRLQALHQEIHDYALALLRARLGLLGVGTSSAATTPALSRAATKTATRGHGRPLPSPAPPESPPVPRAGSPGTFRRGGRDYRVSATMLKRFCDLTGVSESHIGGCGSNLAGIAFYFDVFTILTAETNVPLEALGSLLDRLRETRERIDAFVVHWLNTTGWHCQEFDAEEIGRWLDESSHPPAQPSPSGSLNPPT